MPPHIGMNLRLVKKQPQHDDLSWLPQHIQNNGQKSLIAVHLDTEDIHLVLGDNEEG